MKKRLFALGLIVLTLSMSACKNDTNTGINVDTSETIEQSEDDTVSDYISSEMLVYNWNFDMSENEFKSNVSDLTFSMNNDMSFVSEVVTYKVIDSNSMVDFHGKKAYIQATFVDDELSLLTYVFKFDNGSIIDTPAKDFYTEKSFEYFDMFGSPDSTDSEKGILNTDKATWRGKSGGSVSLYCFEHEPDRSTSYSGTVTITLSGG